MVKISELREYKNTMNIDQLHKDIAEAVQKMGFTTFTQIQEKTIPLILEGHDVLGHSATGSGKTAAFGLPILQDIHLHDTKKIQALILTPTRELCVQVADAINDFSKFIDVSVTSIYGGVGYEPQIRALKKSQVVVATPGRLLDHMQQKSINLDDVRYCVLDEADKMLEMGFLDDVEKIISKLPKKKQTLLFSATMPAPIRRLIKKTLKDPKEITSDILVDKSKLRQIYYDVDARQKFSLLVHSLKENPDGLSLIFCATRREVDILAANLNKQKINAIAIHGGLTQNKRLKAIELLKKEQVNILVATDVAARGLDIKNVQYVYNYDVPKSEQDYLHRIGRTARAGEKGVAVTILSHRDHEAFESVYSENITRVEVPQLEKMFYERNIEIKNSSPQGGRSRFSRGSSQGANRGSRRDRERSGFSKGSSQGANSGSRRDKERSSFRRESSQGANRSSSRNSSQGRPKRNYTNRTR